MLIDTGTMFCKHPFGNLAPCDLSFDGSVEVSENLNQDLNRIVPKKDRFRRTDDVLMLCFSKVVVCNFADAFHNTLCQILLGNIAVVVYKDFKKHS
jgi:hypothetical protein